MSVMLVFAKYMDYMSVEDIYTNAGLQGIASPKCIDCI
jgi:hypothetical protein